MRGRLIRVRGARFAFLGFICLSLVACGGGDLGQTQRWSALSAFNSKPPSERDPIVREMAQQAIEIDLKGTKIHRSKQYWAGVEVDGGWFQRVVDHRGRVQYEATLAVDTSGFDEGLKLRVLALQEAAFDHLNRLRRQYPELRRASWQSAPEVVIRREFGHYAPFLRIAFMVHDETEACTVWVNEIGRVRSFERDVAAHAVMGVATVFPGNPKLTSLSEQVLYDLVGDGTLAGRYVRSTSALQNPPFSLANEFRYRPDEKSFDDVQAYFLADQHTRWFDEVVKVELNRSLELRLHVGAPEPSSVMGYVMGRVYLGDGDGVTWAGIPRDPSIVKHEVGHAFVDQLAGLPAKGEGGSINEAMADFFYAAATGLPRVGEYAYMKAPFVRTLENTKVAYKDFTGGVYNDSLVVSGTFWDIKKSLGSEKSAELAKAFLSRLGPGGKLKDVGPVLQDAAKAILAHEEAAVVAELARSRGW